jgi:hypothetical protein
MKMFNIYDEKLTINELYNSLFVGNIDRILLRKVFCRPCTKKEDDVLYFNGPQLGSNERKIRLSEDELNELEQLLKQGRIACISVPLGVALQQESREYLNKHFYQIFGLASLTTAYTFYGVSKKLPISDNYVVKLGQLMFTYRYEVIENKDRSFGLVKVNTVTDMINEIRRMINFLDKYTSERKTIDQDTVKGIYEIIRKAAADLEEELIS